MEKKNNMNQVNNQANQPWQLSHSPSVGNTSVLAEQPNLVNQESTLKKKVERFERHLGSLEENRHSDDLAHLNRSIVKLIRIVEEQEAKLKELQAADWANRKGRDWEVSYENEKVAKLEGTVESLERMVRELKSVIDRKNLGKINFDGFLPRSELAETKKWFSSEVERVEDYFRNDIKKKFQELEESQTKMKQNTEKKFKDYESLTETQQLLIKTFETNTDLHLPEFNKIHAEISNISAKVETLSYRMECNDIEKNISEHEHDKSSLKIIESGFLKDKLQIIEDRVTNVETRLQDKMGAIKQQMQVSNSCLKEHDVKFNNFANHATSELGVNNRSMEQIVKEKVEEVMSEVVNNKIKELVCNCVKKEVNPTKVNRLQKEELSDTEDINIKANTSLQKNNSTIYAKVKTNTITKLNPQQTNENSSKNIKLKQANHKNKDESTPLKMRKSKKHNSVTVLDTVGAKEFKIKKDISYVSNKKDKENKGIKIKIDKLEEMQNDFN